MNNKQTLLFLFSTLYFSILTCNGQNNLSSKNSINHKEAKVFLGQLDEEQYKKTRKLIESELPHSIPKEHSILINFNQNEFDCHTIYDNRKKFLRSIKDRNRISSRMSSKNLTSDFFVFSPNVKYKERIKMKKNYSIDSGFFSNNIFTNHETCSSFFHFKT